MHCISATLLFLQFLKPTSGALHMSFPGMMFALLFFLLPPAVGFKCAFQKIYLLLPTLNKFKLFFLFVFNYLVILL